MRCHFAALLFITICICAVTPFVNSSPSFLMFDGHAKSFLALPIHNASSSETLSISLWAKSSGGPLNSTSTIFFVGNAASTLPLRGWGLQRTVNSAREGSLSVFYINRAGNVSTVEIDSVAEINEWSYIVSTVISTSSGASVSFFTDRLSPKRLSLPEFAEWVPKQPRHLFVAGSWRMGADNFYGAIFRVGVWNASVQQSDSVFTMRGTTPPNLAPAELSHWPMNEGSGELTQDTISFRSVRVEAGITWMPLSPCNDVVPLDWEQCTSKGKNCTSNCTCANGFTMTVPPSIDCEPVKVIEPPMAQSVTALSFRVLIGVWVSAVVIAFLALFASKFWKRALPSSVPTALVVKMGTEDDLRALEAGSRLDDARAQRLLKSDNDLSRELDPMVELSEAHERLAKSTASDTAVELTHEKIPTRFYGGRPARKPVHTSADAIPRPSRELVFDFSNDAPPDRLTALDVDGIRSAPPGTPLPRARDYSSSDDEIL